MPPYRHADDKSRLPWSGDLSDEEEYFAYPTALVSSAKEAQWESPTKAIRKHTKPVRRRQKPVQGEQGGRESGTPSHANSKEIGPSLGSGLFDDVIDNQSLPPAPRDASSQLPRYVEAVETYSAGFYHAGGSLFVVEGWNLQWIESTGRWYHLRYLWIGRKVSVACTCPQGTQDSCVHQLFFESYDVESLVELQTDVPDLDVAFFVRQQLPNLEDFVTLFSVKSFSSSNLKGRAIVTHTGVHPNSGSWTCSKDSAGTKCIHITSAYKEFLDLLGSDLDEINEDIPVSSIQPATSLGTFRDAA